MPRTFADYRLGGKRSWRIMPDDCEALMRLPDEVLKCVVFFGKEVLDLKTKTISKELGGTGFFIGIDLEKDACVICLVTARHVAQQLEHGEFFIRANLKNGKSADFTLDAGVDAHWIYHPTDDTVDAAVLVWSPPEEVDFKVLPEHMLLNEARMAKKGMGIGDEVYVTGLYRIHPGSNRNEPMARVGHLAMMPKDRIQVPRWHQNGMQGYLIEAHSIGGFSGSPVFICRSVEVVQAQPLDSVGSREPLATGSLFFLGIMHGHWDVPKSLADKMGPKESHETAINAGISIVTPSEKLLEILRQPSFKKNAAKGLAAYREQSATLDGASNMRRNSRVLTAAVSATGSGVFAVVSPIRSKGDSAFSVEGEGAAKVVPEPDNPAHKEDFTSLLGRAATTKPKGD